MPSPQRRSNRRSRSRRSTSRWKRLTRWLTSRAVVGGLWVVAAVICVLVVAFDPMSSISVAEWVRPRVEPEMARGLAAVLVVALVGLTGLGLRRWRGRTSPDRTVESTSSAGSSTRRVVMVGVGLMVLGMAVIVGNWLTSHQHVPAGQLVLPLDESTESFEVDHGDRTVEVMLPMRTTAHYLDLEGEPQVWLQFARPDGEIDDPDHETLQSFHPGDSLDVDGYRFVFSGLTERDAQKRAFVSGTAEQTRRDSGVVGDEIQVSIDGPSFRITDMTDDYLDVFAPAAALEGARAQLMLLAQRYPLGAMGPAVELEDDGDSFWVFERGGQRVDDARYVDESLQLEGIQEVPSPVMTVSEVRAFWPFALGMVLFVLGWALAFAFPERIERRRDDGGTDVWSLNAIEMSPGAGGLDQTGAAKIDGATVVVALAGLALSLGIGGGLAGILTCAALVGLLGVGRRIGQRLSPGAVGPGLVLLGVVAAGIAVTDAGIWWDFQMDVERLLWTAQVGSWMAMGVAVAGAGVVAERNLGDNATGGAVTMGLAVWAAMGSVMALALQRGRAVGEGLGLPLAVDGEPIVWSIPSVEAAADIQIPAVADGTELGVMAATTGLLAAVGVVGAALKFRKVSLFGWIGTLAVSVLGVRHLLGVDGDPAGRSLPEAGIYESMAETRLEAMELPGWIAGLGQFEPAGEPQLHLAALMPEVTAFVAAAAIAVLMIGVVVLGQRGGDSSDPSRLGGRDLMFRAVMFGAMGWGLGLWLGWERLGFVGLRGSMEWLGLSVVFVALGALMLGWRWGASGPQKFLRTFGPGLVLCYLIWVLVVGAAGSTAPGAAIPML